MLIKVIKKQTIFLLKQKEASLTFILLLAVVLGNYITNGVCEENSVNT